MPKPGTTRTSTTRTSTTRTSTTRTSTSRSRTRTKVIASVVLVAAAATAVFAFTLDSGSDSPGAKSEDPAVTEEGPGVPEAVPELVGLARRDKGDALATGPADAPVVMIEYSDFQCPYCGRFARETEKELIRKYVDKGVLRIEWRNFPIFGDESEQAAKASWAAGQQKKFWEFHDVAYEKQRKRNSGEFSKDNLVAMAKKAGVPDLDRFRDDLASDKADAAVDKDRKEGYGLGVSSTPAFLINGRPVLGAQPTDMFTRTIEAAERAAAEKDHKKKTDDEKTDKKTDDNKAGDGR
ncbi:DsbA family protein [Streptomyces sp. NPDC059009]|uniref:DsbA family protein n=1 Tax=Streptomyces sp. NPDC059009 TaxID=3346694 RepID=UPI0036967F9E